tara:strand:- start:88 stop:327 length:240 start_codon:yes stop_codon:yes gene_type:complete
MIINKIKKWFLLIYFVSMSNYAHARVINVNECPVPFDFTISDFCVLSTLGMWFVVPIVIFLVILAIGLIKVILTSVFSR